MPTLADLAQPLQRGFRSLHHHGGSCKINFAPFERFPAGPTRLDGF